MRTLTVGVMGHVDHGKTRLVQALTGIDTDRLAEEKRRGISIALGFAQLRLPGGAVDLVDMPGHERFVRTMVAGATGIAAALLVVAADEGIKPQTVEHLGIARLLGVRHAVVALSKIDATPADRPAAVTAAVRDLLAGTPLADGPIVPTSAATGDGLDRLREALGGLLHALSEPAEHGFFYLPIDRAFPVAGFGTVVTGTLRRGRLAVGDKVAILPLDAVSRVRGLQAHGDPVQAVGPGRRVAVNLRGIEHHRLSRGMALASPGLLVPSRWLDVALEALLESPEGLAQGALVRLLIGTAEAHARVRLLDRPALEPGERGVAQLKVDPPQAVPAGEPFVLRSLTDQRTLAGGRVLDPAPLRHRAGDEAVARVLRTVATADLPAVLRARLDAAGTRGCTLARLAQLTGSATARLQGLLAREDVVRLADGTVLLEAAIEEIEASIVATLDAFHHRLPAAAGMTREAVGASLGAAAPMPAALDAILDRLAARGIIDRSHGLIVRRGFDGRAGLPAAAQHTALRLEALFRSSGLEPPDEAAVTAGDRARQALLALLVRQGVLVRANDRVQGRSILFHREAVAGAVRSLHAQLPDPAGFLVRDAGAVLGISRKYSIPLLEHLDRAGATLRNGDRRRLVVLSDAPGPRQRTA